MELHKLEEFSILSFFQHFLLQRFKIKMQRNALKMKKIKFWKMSHLEKKYITPMIKYIKSIASEGKR